MKTLLLFLLVAIFVLFSHQAVFAQGTGSFLRPDVPEELELATESAEIATQSAEELEKIEQIKKEDVTRPDEPEEKDEILILFERRPTDTLTPINFIAYTLQTAVKVGVPSRTIILILLLPMLATLVAVVRHVIGLPGVGMLVPIALSITLLATGITAGAILLVAILLASTLARIVLKKVRIMQLPKMALSMFFVAIFVFITLLVSGLAGVLIVKQLSIFPVLLLILLSEQIISVQLERSTQEMVTITIVIFAIGILGFLLLSWNLLRDTIFLYPELIFLLIPINVLIGRYFGLRLTEYFRFSPTLRHGSK